MLARAALDGRHCKLSSAENRSLCYARVILAGFLPLLETLRFVFGFFLWPKLGLSPQISKAANSDSRRETGFARRMITGFPEQSHLNTMFTV